MILLFNNRMKNTFLLFAVLIFYLQPAFGQVKQARKEMALYNYSESVKLLKKAIERGKAETIREAVPLLAECYRQMNNWYDAKMWYAKIIALDNAEPEDYYYYGQALRSKGNYPEAKRMFLISDSLSPEDFRGRLYAGYCDSAIIWLEHPPSFETGNVHSLNTPQAEFGTVFYPGGILFTSDRILTKAGKRYGWTGSDYLRLYHTKAMDPDSLNAGFHETELAHRPLNQVWHDGPASFNKNFDKVIINRTQTGRDKPHRGPGAIRTHLLKLVTAMKKEGKWTKPEPFFLNSNNYSVGHPALSSDGHRLFFVSDMPGGYGGTDLYMCTRKEGTWGDPENLGPVINTSGNEMFPFITESGDLYFSSDSHPGFGGLDLFVSFHQDGAWILPANLGHPVNSSFDDFSLATDNSENAGFFSSNRPCGAGEDDIYYFRKLQSADSNLTMAPLHHDTTESVTSHQLAITLEVNKPYRLENIYYDFDKWDIRDDAKLSLDSLVRIMQTYPVSIELGSHTDCRGTEAYNRDLSQKRAESAVVYMISKGIEAERITAKGYGESALINRCNCRRGIICTEREHQENRRTEFRILDRGTNSPLPK